MSYEPPESSFELIQHVFNVLIEVLREPANSDLVPDVLSGCSAVVDLMEDRLDPARAAILYGALARREAAEGLDGALALALYGLDHHLAHFPHDDAVTAERTRVARALFGAQGADDSWPFPEPHP